MKKSKDVDGSLNEETTSNESFRANKEENVIKENLESKKDVHDEPVASSSKIPLQVLEEEEKIPQEECKWWEKEPRDDGKYWDSLKHKGPNFPPAYKSLSEDVKFLYDGREMRLSKNAEEVAGYYAELLDDNRITEEVFQQNFFTEWRNVMNDEERSQITELKKCNFKEMQEYCKNETKKIKQQLEKEKEQYGFCTIDGFEQKIGNCTVELPGLFQGVKSNPKNGMIKKRIQPEDVTINCTADASPDPPPGHQWKDVITNPRVTWLSKWTDPIQNKQKYVKLHESSPLKVKLDCEKYETARRLHEHIDQIRDSYREDWKSQEIKIQQRGVALYFIDKLAFRVGHEKDEDAVGCCSLRAEHVKLPVDDKDYVVSFDFHEKGLTHYKNKVTIEELPFKHLEKFIENKNPKNNLFEHLDATGLNKHLNKFMEGLTAKVFRTYNASLTFQRKLDGLIKPGASPKEQKRFYKEAALAAATLCNHQRTDHSPTKPQQSIDVLTKQLEQLNLPQAKDGSKVTNTENTILYYLDPRITVAWCKKNNVRIEDIFTTKKERDKFHWATEIAGPDYRFENIKSNIRKKLKF